MTPILRLKYTSVASDQLYGRSFGNWSSCRRDFTDRLDPLWRWSLTTHARRSVYKTHLGKATVSEDVLLISTAAGG